MRRLGAAVLFGALVLALLPVRGSATETLPVIGAGREPAALELLSPYALHQEVIDGVVIDSVRLEPRRIVVRMVSPAGEAELHLLVTPSATAHGGSFELSVPDARFTPPELRRAAAKLARVVRENDDGTFFADVPLRPREQFVTGIRTGEEDEAFLRARLLLAAAALLWGVLAATMVMSTLSAGISRRAALRGGIVFAVVLGVAWVARVTLPATALHANTHAYAGFEVALALPESENTTAARVLTNGPGWYAAQRALTPFVGRHHDGVMALCAIFGALALALAAVGALRAGSGVGGAIMAGVLLALVPAWARVGRSESIFVVGQLLVGATLFLAPRQERMAARVGVWIALVLLTSGQLLGAAFAGGVACMAWALSPGVRRLPVLYASAVLLGALPSAMTHLAVVARHAGEIRLITPLLPRFWNNQLWLHLEWGARGLLLLLGMGLVALAWPRGDSRGAWRLAAGLMGAHILLIAGLQVHGALSDALRYQSLLAPFLVPLVAFAPSLARLVPGAPAWARLSRRGALVLLAAGLLWSASELARAGAGRAVLDSQGQAYRHLRATLAAHRGDIWLIAADKAGRVENNLPLGPLSASGPRIRALPLAEAHARCEREGRLPPATMVWLPPHTRVEVAGRRLAEKLWPFVDEGGKVSAAEVVPLPDSLVPGETGGEFHRLTAESARTALYAAICPED